MPRHVLRRGLNDMWFTCPCGKRQEAPSEQAGRTVKCVACGKELLLTRKSAPKKDTPKKDTPEKETPKKDTTTQHEGGQVAKPATGKVKRIGEAMVEAGLITKAQLDEALAAQAKKGGKVVQRLIMLGYIDAATFANFLSQQPGIASLDLSCYDISEELVKIVPQELATKHEVFPIDRIGKTLTLGMVCPLDKATVEEIENTTGLRVKPLLCNPDDIRIAIDRYYPGDGPAKLAPSRPAHEERLQVLESSLRLQQVADLICNIESLPALPETIQRVREAMTDPDSSIKDVSDIIIMDPPVAAKILSVANSAAYGFPQRVEDFTLAVSLLGLRETYCIVLSVAVIDLFKKSKHFDYKGFWVEAMCCAAASRLVAKAAGQRKRVGVFSAGLLHNIGRVALSEVAPEIYAKIDQSIAGDELLAAEQSTIGLSHTEAGFELAIHWGLPKDIAAAIRYHHDPAQAPEENDVVAMVAVADKMVHSVGTDIEENEAFFESAQDSLAMLKVDREAAEAMLDEYLANRDESLRTL